MVDIPPFVTSMKGKRRESLLSPDNILSAWRAAEIRTLLMRLNGAHKPLCLVVTLSRLS